MALIFALQRTFDYAPLSAAISLSMALIFALQRAFDYAPLSAAISLSMGRSIGFGTRCKET
ncbi:hypothetical protein LEP1GSC187_2311 [Leptospira santarosai str. ZUN179]|uniref:Uncharacterized protein n=1 Tax=Leptospira santarosai str. ZUN179 TaxID=1049985 RepID=M6V015_9LEPT|nr:hypothetical protein LEP1GSC187_2311 [Leptospira santarosai str. ZUN179]